MAPHPKHQNGTHQDHEMLRADGYLVIMLINFFLLLVQSFDGFLVSVDLPLVGFYLIVMVFLQVLELFLLLEGKTKNTARGLW